MRPDGFYWVWFGGRWVAAEWSNEVAGISAGAGWLLPGYSWARPDKDFERISALLPTPWTSYEGLDKNWYKTRIAQEGDLDVTAGIPAEE